MVRSFANITKWDNRPGLVGAAMEATLRAAQFSRTAAQGPAYVNLDATLQEEALGAMPAMRARSVWWFAISPDYEAAFARVVEQERVEWLDLPSLFAAADPRFRGSALMHDWGHPNRAGNAVIARALADALRATGAGASGPTRAGSSLASAVATRR